MNICPAKLQEVPSILRVGYTLDELQVSDEFITFWPESILIDCINSNNNSILVADEKDEIIGFIIENYNLSFKK